ncbi:hypothetical protein CMV_010366 [Castanea mollissima]|uniref:Uncharacterized protein n=1 Tax=Castanea mollissima TaxID=60419 RepID=A0A8J4VQ25_9ROSI|nr:hypothetical protein CMV_010366 [Castanea mollissima]
MSQLPFHIERGRKVLRSPERKQGLADVTREMSRIKEFRLNDALLYSYMYDLRFALLTCLVIGFSIWWMAVPEPLLESPKALCSPNLEMLVNVARDTYVNKVCSTHSLPSPCECGEPLNNSASPYRRLDQISYPFSFQEEGDLGLTITQFGKLPKIGIGQSGNIFKNKRRLLACIAGIQNALARRRKNKVMALKHGDGSWVSDSEQLKTLVVEYYKCLYSADRDRAFAVAEVGEECSTSPPKTQGLPPNPGYLRGSFSSSMENAVSPKFAAWGELEFRKAFLILTPKYIPSITDTFLGAQIRKHIDGTLGSGNLREDVKLPTGADLNEWLAIIVLFIAAPFDMISCLESLHCIHVEECSYNAENPYVALVIIGGFSNQ